MARHSVPVTSSVRVCSLTRRTSRSVCMRYWMRSAIVRMTQLVTLGETLEVGLARHGSVVVHDLADDARRGAARRGARDRPTPRFGRCAPARRPVAREAETRGPGVTRSSGLASGRMAVRMVCARSAALMPVVTPRARLDAHRERRAERRAASPGGLHHGQLEAVDELLVEGEADEAAPVDGHEVDGFGRDALGRHREIPLVLAIFVVDEDDHLARTHFVERPCSRASDRSASMSSRWGMEAHEAYAPPAFCKAELSGRGMNRRRGGSSPLHESSAFSLASRRRLDSRCVGGGEEAGDVASEEIDFEVRFVARTQGAEGGHGRACGG